MAWSNCVAVASSRCFSLGSMVFLVSLQGPPLRPTPQTSLCRSPCHLHTPVFFQDGSDQPRVLFLGCPSRAQPSRSSPSSLASTFSCGQSPSHRPRPGSRVRGRRTRVPRQLCVGAGRSEPPIPTALPLAAASLPAIFWLHLYEAPLLLESDGLTFAPVTVFWLPQLGNATEDPNLA